MFFLACGENTSNEMVNCQTTGSGCPQGFVCEETPPNTYTCVLEQPNTDAGMPGALLNDMLSPGTAVVDMSTDAVVPPDDAVMDAGGTDVAVAPMLDAALCPPLKNRSDPVVVNRFEDGSPAPGMSAGQYRVIVPQDHEALAEHAPNVLLGCHVLWLMSWGIVTPGDKSLCTTVALSRAEPKRSRGSSMSDCLKCRLDVSIILRCGHQTPRRVVINTHLRMSLCTRFSLPTYPLG